MGRDGAVRMELDRQLGGFLGFEVADAVPPGAEKVLPVDGGQQKVRAGKALERLVQLLGQVGVTQMQDRESAEIELIAQRHAGVGRLQNVFRMGRRKRPHRHAVERDGAPVL